MTTVQDLLALMDQLAAVFDKHQHNLQATSDRLDKTKATFDKAMAKLDAVEEQCVAMTAVLLATSPKS